MNIEMLRKEMYGKRIPVTQLAKELEISVNALYNRLNGKTEFKRNEIAKIIELLNLENPMAIFFDAKVSKRTQRPKRHKGGNYAKH